MGKKKNVFIDHLPATASNKQDGHAQAYIS